MLTCLAGGVGASKLLTGLKHVMDPETGNIIVNTADDEIFYGLHVSPDIDTIAYSLAGLGDEVKGWGIRDDTFNALSMLSVYGVETWFRIGDKDLATHVFRTMRLREGASLTQVTREIAEKLGVSWRILPMTDDRVKTLVQTSEGWMPFQAYFVKHQHRPRIFGVKFEGIEKARPTKEVIESLTEAKHVVICPSNPVVSIGPILALDGVRDLLCEAEASVLGVSPIVGGRALKGPAAEMMEAMGFEASPAGVAAFYKDFLDVLVVDEVDRQHVEEVRAYGVKPAVTQTVMNNLEDKIRLARFCLNLLGKKT
ncbi:MAG: 2-phospho-L-lactate transferase [Candidatus Caldarchaeum sp.]|nr:2-phospho-L-lactate transferase [Candidatus Caldarchaeum sp.]